MAINSCSINAFTINSLQCRRKSFGPPPAAKSHVQQVRYQNWLGSLPADAEVEQLIGQLESSHINVAITLNGKTYEQTLENSIHDVTPMIAISAINIDLSTNQRVEVLNLQLRKIREE